MEDPNITVTLTAKGATVLREMRRYWEAGYDTDDIGYDDNGNGFLRSGHSLPVKRTETFDEWVKRDLEEFRAENVKKYGEREL